MSRFSLSSSIVAKSEIASCGLGLGVALLDLEHSQYFSLNPVAAEIWDHIQQPTTVQDLARIVRDKFEAGAADVEADIIRLLDEMAELQLIQAVDG